MVNSNSNVFDAHAAYALLQQCHYTLEGMDDEDEDDGDEDWSVVPQERSEHRAGEDDVAYTASFSASSNGTGMVRLRIPVVAEEFGHTINFIGVPLKLTDAPFQEILTLESIFPSLYCMMTAYNQERGEHTLYDGMLQHLLHVVGKYSAASGEPAEREVAHGVYSATFTIPTELQTVIPTTPEYAPAQAYISRLARRTAVQVLAYGISTLSPQNTGQHRHTEVWDIVLPPIDAPATPGQWANLDRFVSISKITLLWRSPRRPHA